MKNLFIAIVALLLAAPAVAGTKWTHDKEGTGPQVNYLLKNAYAYYVFTTIEESNWLRVERGSHVDICATANIATEVANGVELVIMKSILHINETPLDGYSEIVLGVTLTGVGSGACIYSSHPGWYKVMVTDGPDTGTGMVSVVESALWE